jgi:hypothetical protein
MKFPEQRQLGSLFTDIRNSVENQLTNLLPNTININSSTTPAAAPVPVTTTASIGGFSPMTLGIVGLGGLIAWKLLGRRKK